MTPLDLPLGDRHFIAAHPHAGMITVGDDGRPKVVKVEAALVDDCLESASHADKLPTHRLQHHPRCTLYFADDEHRWLSMEANVEIVAGPEAPAQLLRYFRVREGKPTEPLDYHSDRIDRVG
jgi:Pyridoxamine 5'-phosphate oxidase